MNRWYALPTIWIITGYFIVKCTSNKKRGTESAGRTIVCTLQQESHSCVHTYSECMCFLWEYMYLVHKLFIITLRNNPLLVAICCGKLNLIHQNEKNVRFPDSKCRSLFMWRGIQKRPGLASCDETVLFLGHKSNGTWKSCRSLKCAGNCHVTL